MRYLKTQILKKLTFFFFPLNIRSTVRRKRKEGAVDASILSGETKNISKGKRKQKEKEVRTKPLCFVDGSFLWISYGFTKN